MAQGSGRMERSSMVVIMTDTQSCPAGKWRYVRMNQPAPEGDDFVVIAAAEYEQWRRQFKEDRAATAPPGYALVPLEPTPEMIGAWYRVKNGHYFHDEPPPTDTSDYAAYRALIRAATSRGNAHE